MIPIFDAHLDLAYNALGYDRDLTLPLSAIREREAALTTHCPATPDATWDTSDEHWGTATVTLPQMRAAGVRACLATLLVRAPESRPLQCAPRRFDLDHAHPWIAEAVALGQLAYYERLERAGEIALVHSANDLHGMDRLEGPILCVLSMEGCDPIVSPDDVPAWWERGLRTACLAHYRQGRYAYGTGGEGGLTDLGRQLLDAFADVGMILDLVHTAEPGFREALDQFDGAVFVSHANCRALVPGDRQLADAQIQAVVQRGGVMGVALDAWMLTPNYDRRTTPRERVTLDTLADHIDHVCQLTGNARHVGIGSDLDGGFGVEQCPAGVDSIADLQQLAAILAQRGYTVADVEAIFHGNWSRFFRANLPHSSATPLTPHRTRQA